MAFMLIPLLILAILLLPIWVIGSVVANRREITRLRERVDELERRLVREAGLPPVLTPVESPTSAAHVPPIPLRSSTSPAMPPGYT